MAACCEDKSSKRTRLRPGAEEAGSNEPHFPQSLFFPLVLPSDPQSGNSTPVPGENPPGGSRHRVRWKNPGPPDPTLHKLFNLG